MKIFRGVRLTVLVALLAAGMIGLYFTGASQNSSRQQKTANGQIVSSELLNQRYLNTARHVSEFATSPDEQQLAQDALRVADRELDLEFASALQSTASFAGPQTPEVHSIQQRISKIENAIQGKQDEVNQLTDAAKRARRNQVDDLQQQLDVSQAELNLYKEALGDAKDDLIRAGGDPHSKVQQLVEEHESASHQADSFKLPPLSEPTSETSRTNVLAQWSHWRAVRQKLNEILQAQQEAYKAAAEVAQAHDAKEKEIQKEQAQNADWAAARHGQAPVVSGSMGETQTSKQALASLKHLSESRKSLAILGRRIQDLQELGSIYGKWAVLADADQRSALHGIIASALWIVLILLAVFLINRGVEHSFNRLSLENKQRNTLQAVIRISVQVLAVLTILIIIFGPPNQLSTVLGLAGAGLTVVLKDFIVSFLGWFVLMGRQGIRVGDWVEINGVHGEVIEITLLRTILLETGNWTDAGQPTGRQVAFLNQYAIDGYYFNFTTSGQWLWDELQVLVPGSQNPYPTVDKIREIIAKETESDTHQAEREWQRVSRRYGVRSFSAEPTVNMKPTDTGVVVVVRYITRADERSEMRYRLNHAMVKLLRGGAEVLPPAEPAPAPAGSGR